MAQRNTWFATSVDAQLVVSWLRDTGAVGHDNPLPTAACPSDGREFILHFPSVGPIEFWPDEVRPSDYTEGSERWRQAVIIAHSQKEHPGQRQVDADRSAAAVCDCRSSVTVNIGFPAVCGFRVHAYARRFPIWRASVSGSTASFDSSRRSTKIPITALLFRSIINSA